MNGEQEKRINAPVTDVMIIEVNGQFVRAPRREALTVVMHKPVGLACSNDPREAPLVNDCLPAEWQNLGLNTVGRLDRATSGLLLLTNDGSLLHRLIHPKRKVPKRYQISYSGQLKGQSIQLVADGLTLADDPKPCLPAELILQTEGQATMVIHEGRYHQVRRMIQCLGGEVTDLHRDRLGSLDLPKDLEPGSMREIRAEELIAAQQADE